MSLFIPRRDKGSEQEDFFWGGGGDQLLSRWTKCGVAVLSLDRFGGGEGAESKAINFCLVEWWQGSCQRFVSIIFDASMTFGSLNAFPPISDRGKTQNYSAPRRKSVIFIWRRKCGLRIAFYIPKKHRRKAWFVKLKGIELHFDHSPSFLLSSNGIGFKVPYK